MLRSDLESQLDDMTNRETGFDFTNDRPPNFPTNTTLDRSKFELWEATWSGSYPDCEACCEEAETLRIVRKEDEARFDNLIRRINDIRIFSGGCAEHPVSPLIKGDLTTLTARASALASEVSDATDPVQFLGRIADVRLELQKQISTLSAEESTACQDCNKVTKASMAILQRIVERLIPTEEACNDQIVLQWKK